MGVDLPFIRTFVPGRYLLINVCGAPSVVVSLYVGRRLDSIPLSTAERLGVELRSSIYVGHINVYAF